MTADAQGYDPELNYTAEDNEFWDATDAAHPAWWRGEECGVAGMIRLVNKWLDEPIEELRHGTHYEHVQQVKERILDLRTKHGF